MTHGIHSEGGGEPCEGRQPCGNTVVCREPQRPGSALCAPAVPGTGSNPGHAPALPALSSAGPPGQEAANANVGKVI